MIGERGERKSGGYQLSYLKYWEPAKTGNKRYRGALFWALIIMPYSVP